MKTTILFVSAAKLWLVASPVLATVIFILLGARICNAMFAVLTSEFGGRQAGGVSRGYAGRLVGLVVIVVALVLASVLESVGQVSEPVSDNSERVFEDPQTKEKVTIVVGDVVRLKLKRPQVEVTGEVVSLTDSAIVVSVKQPPFFQSFLVDNIQSLSISSRGGLYRYGSIAKNDSSTYRIETNNGNEFIGKIIAQDLQTVRLRTEALGEITIRKVDIREIEDVSAHRIIGGTLWFDNPQATRYFWQPNGYGVKKGEAYYQNVWVLFNQFTLGVSDNFSIGAGMVPLFLFGGAPTPIWANAKFSVPVKPGQLNLGGGVLAGTVIGNDGDEATSSGFGVAYGISTFGSRDKNFSIGFGYGFAGGDWASKPTISLSAMVRTGPRGYLLTENYYLGSADDGLVLISLGARRIVKRTGIDFGLFMPFSKDIGTVVGIPWLGITTPLGK